MLSTTTLRSTRAVIPRLHPSPFASCTAAPYSTSPSTPKTQHCQPSATRRPATHKPSILFPSRRHASTAPATTSPISTPSSVPETLTWNRFLALRKTRRRLSLLTSMVSAVGFTGVGVVTLMERDLDQWGAATLGLDPMIMLGLGTIGFAGVGWLMGPFFGNAVFNAMYRNVRGQIEAKERAFYARIKKHRVDPTASSLSNPVPDYYGEKIGSVSDYRRWLKDQRAFRLKRGGAGTPGMPFI